MWTWRLLRVIFSRSSDVAKYSGIVEVVGAGVTNCDGRRTIGNTVYEAEAFLFPHSCRTGRETLKYLVSNSVC